MKTFASKKEGERNLTQKTVDKELLEKFSKGEGREKYLWPRRQWINICCVEFFLHSRNGKKRKRCRGETPNARSPNVGRWKVYKKLVFNLFVKPGRELVHARRNGNVGRKLFLFYLRCQGKAKTFSSVFWTFDVTTGPSSARAIDITTGTSSARTRDFNWNFSFDRCQSILFQQPTEAIIRKINGRAERKIEEITDV